MIEELYYINHLAVMGAKKFGKSVSEKKANPVVRIVMGVINAATPQPKFLKIIRPAIVS